VAYKIPTPGNHPEENIQHTENGESNEIKNVCIPCPWADRERAGIDSGPAVVRCVHISGLHCLRGNGVLFQ
jgi:hypothetical protein